MQPYPIAKPYQGRRTRKKKERKKPNFHQRHFWNPPVFLDVEIHTLSRVYFQLSRFRICQCLWWPSSSLAEQKKPNQRRGGERKKEGGKKNRSKWRNAGRDIALRYSQAFDDKRAYMKTAAWQTCARRPRAAESDGNLPQSPGVLVLLLELTYGSMRALCTEIMKASRSQAICECAIKRECERRCSSRHSLFQQWQLRL